MPTRTNPIKSVRNVLRFGRSRSSSVEEDERALVSNPNIAAASATTPNESSDTDAIHRLGNGHEDVESGAQFLPRLSELTEVWVIFGSRC